MKERRSYWCARQSKWRSLENLVGKSCLRQGVPTAAVASLRLRDDCNVTGV